MSTVVLNEHDANQGAQSKGEFLGMTGNSAWYLLGSAGATVLMVIVLWGIFDVPLLLCLVVGICLCLLSVLYVFTLKNNKPAHYDTDFFEAAFVEAGVFELAFGPRAPARRPNNPFSDQAGVDAHVSNAAPKEKHERRTQPRNASAQRQLVAASSESDQTNEPKRVRKSKSDEPVQTVPLRAYEKLQTELEMVQEQLTDVLAERGEI